jgi:hypothetical protein
MESMYNNCESLVKSYLLYQNPLYVYSFPIALIVAIVMYGICSTMKWCQNSYVAQIIVPVFTIFVVIWILDAVAKSMLNTRKVDELMGVCTQAMAKIGAAEHFTERMDISKRHGKAVDEKSQVHPPIGSNRSRLDMPTPTPSPNASAQMSPNVAVADAYQQKLEDEGQLRAPLNDIDDLYNSTVSVINPDTTAYKLPYNGLNTPSEAVIR